MESMTGYGESHFTAEGASIICSARSINSRFLEVEFFFPSEISWFKTQSESIIRRKFTRGRIEITFQSAGALPSDIIFNTDLISQYEKLVSQRLGKKKFALEPREFLSIPGFVEHRVKNWRAYQNKFEFHLMRALLKMQRTRLIEGRRIVRACLTHVRYLKRILRRVNTLQIQAHRRKSNTVRHRILNDFLSIQTNDNVTASATSQKFKSGKGAMRVARQIWNDYKEEILRTVQNDLTEEINRIAGHLERMLKILKSNQSAGRELEFYLQELQRETNTIGAKAQDSEINSLVVLMKTEIEKLREQIRNLE